MIQHKFYLHYSVFGNLVNFLKESPCQYPEVFYALNVAVAYLHVSKSNLTYHPTQIKGSLFPE